MSVKISHLDNGLQVVVMNHGEAPLVQIGLMVKGNNLVAPKRGMDSLAEALYRVSSSEFTDMTVDPLQVAGNAYRVEDAILASGSSGNVEALLHKTRSLLDNIDWVMANKTQQVKKWRGSSVGAGTDPEVWASRLRNQYLFPNNPYGTWMTPADYDVVDEFSKAELVDWQQTLEQVDRGL